MAATVYSLCAVTAMLCSFLLLQAYYRSKGNRLLLWSGLCFAGLTFNNLLLVLDKIIFPAVNLSILRTSVALLAMVVLLYGLIWSTD
jgi:hypothetical protein